MRGENPLNICTWNDSSDCANCTIQDELSCRWDRKVLSGFHAIAFPPTIMAIFGIAFVGFLTGVWWLLITYLVYLFAMFGFEIRFLCSHCPYYAEESKILHCLGNHGSPKLWRYHPEPMNKFERFMMRFLVATIFFVLPLSVMGYGIWFLYLQYAEYGLIALLGLTGVAIASLITSTSFVSTLKIFFCSRCVNFSCPLNTVPKPVVDEYLMKNDVMRKAWEETGYKPE
ncbi:MAG: hypothetical protein C4B59_01700 [Candidatus Methanogaster sp.]|uniref:Uncharacterized protein n=1 Tax=Candidatus Methanogaster sp. TaxID=3386292 RepID=A0AC61L6D6_9EURY|nr:MAG: hypothetical protein C4B59_01700 [ANME-2 cluster archaeon]